MRFQPILARTKTSTSNSTERGLSRGFSDGHPPIKTPTGLPLGVGSASLGGLSAQWVWCRHQQR